MTAPSKFGYSPRLGTGGGSSRRSTNLPMGWILGLGALLAVLLLLFVIGSTGTTDEADADPITSDLVAKVQPALVRVGYPNIDVQADGRTIVLSGEVATRSDVVAANAVAYSFAEVAEVINQLTYEGEPELGTLPSGETGTIVNGASSSADLLLQSRLSTVAALQPIIFESGSAEMIESQATITRVAELLNETPGVRIEIGGHTDADGIPEENETLSQARADAVLTSLIAAGVESDRLIAVGYGDEKPISDNETREGRARNRRIGFLILN